MIAKSFEVRVRFILMMTLLFSASGSAQVPFGFWRVASTPTYIQKAETTWTGGVSSKTTASFNVLAGDMLIAYAAMESDPSGIDVGVSGGNLAWVNLVTRDSNSDSYSEVRIWKAVVDANKAMTVTFTGNSAYNFGGNVLTFRNSSGTGAATGTSASGAPSLNVTTTKANSAVVVVNSDWNAVDGASRTWRLGAAELSYSYISARYTAYGAYTANVGAIGTYAVGLSAPVGQKFAIGAVEVQSGAAATFCNGTSTPAPGTVCTDGSVFAGRSSDTGAPMYTTPADAASTYPWNNGNATGYVTTGLTSRTTGESNSDTLATLDSDSGVGGTQPYQAAQYCANLSAHGNTDWYLPSIDELTMLYWNRTAIGGFSATEYWSSTETDLDEARVFRFGLGSEGPWTKSVGNLQVRCVRN